MPYLSAMLGKRIEDADGNPLGRLEDIVALPGARFPVVSGVMVHSGHGRNRRRFFVPWDKVSYQRANLMVVQKNVEDSRPGPEDVFLARDLLDKQIVDLDGYKIVRVNDIRLASAGREMRVLGADVGLVAILRRLGLAPSGYPGRRDRAVGRGDRIVPWNLVAPVSPMPHEVRLRVPYRKYLKIHPSDIADIIEQLDIDQRAKVLALIEDPKAAEVLTQILPQIRSSVAEAMDDERLSDLLEIMPPDEAADILGSLPREKALVLLSLMGIEEASVVSELLGYDADTAGGRMTTEFVALRNSMTVAETIDLLRKKGAEAETIYYVYVVDGEVHLSGVLSLRDLLRARPDEIIGNIMKRDIIAADIQDDQELVAERLSRYKLLAMPVLDVDHVLKGIVTVDDVIDVIREETVEDFSQLSGVPFEEQGTPIRDTLDPRRWAGTLLTFLGGILATALFGIFRNEFVAAIALVYLVPLALRGAHDVSLWSVAVSVRDLRLVKLRDEKTRNVFAREYTLTLAAALLISLFGFLAGMIWTRSIGSSLAGGIGLFVGIAVAGVLGFMIPLVIRRFVSEPAVGQGRLVGIIVMAVSIVSFLAVSGLLNGVFG
ncbi:MAG: magnesium transporter [Actinobacteria bacterium]|nr:magnesium transporter [Actinomycetota bacterium]